MSFDELLFRLPTALIICLIGVAFIMLVLFPPTKILWSQRTLADKMIRIVLSGIVLFGCLTLGTILLP